ncbi:MAG: hypothetical protein JNK67_18245 [Alphaproteobacteria bacterium]|nr:hypothetical protein [Alphaproteobacteria bacterium]
MKHFAAFAFVFLAWLAPAQAVDLGRMYDAAALVPWQQNYVGFVRQQLAPIYEQLTPDERARIPRLNVDVPVHGTLRAPFEFRSQIADGVRIDMAASAIKFLGDTMTAATWIGRNGYDLRPLNDYLGLLKYEPVSPPGGRLPDPQSALGVPRGAGEDPALQRDVGALLTSALRFALLHEIGHAVTNSDPAATGDLARAQDIRADAFALDVMRRLGAMPNGIALMLWVQGQLQPHALDLADAPKWTDALALFRRPITAARAATLAATLSRDAPGFAARQADPAAAAAVVNATAQQLAAFANTLDSRDHQAMNRRIGNTARWTLLQPVKAGELIAVPDGLAAGNGPNNFHGAFDGAVRVGDQTTAVRILLWRTGDDVIGVAANALYMTHLTGRASGNSLRFTYEAFDLRGAGTLQMDAGADTLTGAYGDGTAASGSGTIAARRRKP